jgi:4-amino-4-deoxy-L-arabinose transferase-like glycosyltransferase
MRRVWLSAAVLAAIVLVCLLYLGNLSAMGLVSTDEPRYADIGRAMAQTGDWVTPRLWGHPWFEKPPLLYWLAASGFRLGLGPELAPRLPVALLSLLFLGFYWFRLRALWDSRTATYSTALLATSAGWLACSHVAITDIPLAVFFSAAVLLALAPDRPRFTLIAALLGLATLAKSLPPLVFFLPVLALDYRRLRSWLSPGPLLAFAAVSLPWHVLCTLQNGPEFLRVLFIEHQFGRFLSPDLQHVQPFWYFVPVLPLLLFPWFPLALLASHDFRDRRVRILSAVAIFGFVFLSLSRNKLATYLLPLLPSVCALIGAGLAQRNFARGFRGLPAWLLALSVALLGILPVAAGVLPVALATGLRTAYLPLQRLPLWMAAALLAGAAIAGIFKRNGFYGAAAVAAVGFLCFEEAVFPNIDKIVSARPLWVSQHPRCVPELHRRMLYGLNYYAGRELPRCVILDQAPVTVVR